MKFAAVCSWRHWVVACICLLGHAHIDNASQIGKPTRWKGIHVYGVERQHSDDNEYDRRIPILLRSRGVQPIVYSNIEEMVTKVSASVGPNTGIKELTLYGHASPGLFCLGNGQRETFERDTYISYDNVREIADDLLDLKDLFSKDAKLILIGSNVGARREGAKLLFDLSRLLGVIVRGPVDSVFSESSYQGPWQEARPDMVVPPELKKASARSSPKQRQSVEPETEEPPKPNSQESPRPKTQELPKPKADESPRSETPQHPNPAAAKNRRARQASAKSIMLGRRLKLVLVDVKKNLRLSEEHLRVIELPNGPGSAAFSVREEPKLIRASLSRPSTAFVAEEVIKAINSARNQLLSRLSGQEFIALRAYIRKFYLNTDSIDTFSSPHYPKPLVTQPIKENAFENASRFIEKMELVSKNTTVDLEVKSDPTEAAVIIWASRGTRRTMTTNSIFHNLCRGYYSYKVTKTGFKQIEETLNLIDEEGSLFECKLHKRDNPEGPYPCSIK